MPANYNYNSQQLVLLKSLDENKKTSKAYRKFKSAIKTKKTLSSYRLALDKFMILSKQTNYDKVVKLKPDQIQDLLEEFVMSLAHLKWNSVNVYLSAVELLFEMNMVLIHKRILRKLMPSDDEELFGKSPYTSEDIRSMLSVTIKLRSKFIIHFFASTGMRPLGIEDPILRLKHVEDMPLSCKSVKIYEGSKQSYYAFLTPECTKALNDYLALRVRNGEVLTSESVLFANAQDNLKTKQAHMSQSSLRQVIKDSITKSKVDQVSKGLRNEIALFGGFRKRFNTILKLNEFVNDNIVEKLMSHKRGLDGTYLTPTKEECFKEFVKGIIDLTLDQTEKQKIEIQKLETEKDELVKTQSENTKLRHREMKNYMAHLEDQKRIFKLENGRDMTREEFDKIE